MIPYFRDMKAIANKWKYHALLILIVIILDLYADYIYKGQAGFISNFQYPYFLYVISMYISFLSVYVLNFSFLCPATLTKKRYVPFILGAIFLVFTFAGIRYFLEEVVLYSILGQHNYADRTRAFAYYVFDNTYYSIKAILFSTTLFLLFRFVENQTKLFQLQIETKKAELQFLKSQLGPHFLFNTLNTFYGELIETQPETARDIHKLSDLLRFVTYDAQQDFVPLEKDLKFIDEYLYFFKKRYESMYAVNYECTGVVADQKVPSMVLIHFVENVFKHGVVTDPLACAKIGISISEHTLTMTTTNKMNTSEKYEHKGIGYASLERRLDVLFEDAYHLEYHNDTINFNATLTIPI